MKNKILTQEEIAIRRVLAQSGLLGKKAKIASESLQCKEIFINDYEKLDGTNVSSHYKYVWTK